MKYWICIAATLLALSACRKEAAPAVPEPVDVTSTATSIEEAASAWDAQACGDLPDALLSSVQGHFFVAVCDQAAASNSGAASGTEMEGAEEDAQGASGMTEIRFLHRDDEGDTLGSVWIENTQLSAVVDDMEGKLWGEHLLTMELRAERGGMLLVGNWTGKAFAIGQYHYMTHDDDDLTLAWDGKNLLVTTAIDGARRLIPDAVDGFKEEALTCTVESEEGGVGHQLSLPVDVNGEIMAFRYLATAPAADGTVFSCAIDASPEDGFSSWETLENGDKRITYEADAEDSWGEESIDIERQGDLYTVSIGVRQSRFCGQSTEIARLITLRKGQSVCRLPQEED
jgi:hypothetical protein